MRTQFWKTIQLLLATLISSRNSSSFTSTKPFFLSLSPSPTITGSRSIIWPCEDSSDCKAENAHCSIYGYCQCPAGYVFSTDVTRCLPESAYGVACQEAVQCSHMLTGAKCEAGVCTCDSDYTYVRGRCRKLVDLGQPCSDDIDCFFSHNRESVVCHRGSCECADGFYRRSSNVCRRRVTSEFLIALPAANPSFPAALLLKFRTQSLLLCKWTPGGSLLLTDKQSCYPQRGTHDERASRTQEC